MPLKPLEYVNVIVATDVDESVKRVLGRTPAAQVISATRVRARQVHAIPTTLRMSGMLIPSRRTQVAIGPGAKRRSRHVIIDAKVIMTPDRIAISAQHASISLKLDTVEELRLKSERVFVEHVPKLQT